MTLKVRDTLKGGAQGTYTFRQYIWDLRDVRDAAGYHKGQEYVLLMNAPSRYGLTSPAGMEQGKFRVLRDASGRQVAVNGRGNAFLMRGVAAELAKSGAALTRDASSLVAKHQRGPIPVDDLVRLIRELARGAADGRGPRLAPSRRCRLRDRRRTRRRQRRRRRPAVSRRERRSVPVEYGAADRVPHGRRRPELAGQTGAQAQTRVDGMFDVWQNVASSSIAYLRAGAIQAVGGFSDGDVSTAAEFNAVDGDCGDGNQSPIIYDVNGSLFEDLGQDPRSSVSRVPAPSTATASRRQRHRRHERYLPGRRRHGENFELTAPEFDAAFIHEFGHFSGLDHSQVNVNCFDGACGSDDFAGLPTMFPFLVSDQQRTLSTDDIAWISRLYPRAAERSPRRTGPFPASSISPTASRTRSSST